MIGEVVGGYRITGKLGEGGMGVVYLAEHTIMGRKAVVKVLKPDLSTNPEMVQRFFNEARAAGSISHPGIVSVFDLGTRDDGSAYIVMDFLEGESLFQRLKQRGRLPAPEALAITRQILSALSAAHAQGIVHRDLKPDNIFLVPDVELPGGERVKLLDFGIAKLQDDSGESLVTTRAGAVMGTPMYMSPEQCRGTGVYDKRTDIYSVGIMLFELLTGRPPFVAEALGDLMAAHIRDAPPSLSERLGQVPQELEEIVATFLAKAPDDRFASGEIAIARIDAATRGAYASNADLRQPSPGAAAPLDAMAPTLMGDTGLPHAQPVAPVPSAAAHHPGSGLSPVQTESGTTLRNSVSSVSTSEALENAPRATKRSPLLWPALAVLLAGAGLSLFFLGQDQKPDELEAINLSGANADAGMAPVPLSLDAALDVTRPPTPRADALPAIVLSGVAPEQVQAGRRAHARALRLHRADDMDGAIAAYEESLRADPGHIMSRYNYACLLNLADQRDEGLAILKQLKEEGCPICLGRLIRARSDSEWESAWDDPVFIELTQGVRLKQPSAREAALTLAEALRAGDMTSLGSLIHPRAALQVRLIQEDCPGRKRDCRELVKLRGLEELTAWQGVHENSFGAGEIDSCRKECCRFQPAEDVRYSLKEMCSSLDSGTVRTLSELEFLQRP